jgi:hypothetical protein
MRILMAVAMAAIPALGQDGDVQQRSAALKRSRAEMHLRCARHLRDAGMHAAALREYRLAASYNPELEEAQKACGLRKRADGSWERDPDARPPTDRKTGADAELALTESRLVKQRLERELAKEYAAAAEAFAADAEGSRRLYMEALDLDPDSEKVRKALRHARTGKDGPWLSTEEALLQRRLRDTLKAAPKGKPYDKPTDVELLLKTEHVKQISRSAIIESSDIERSTLESLAQHADTASAVTLTQLNLRDWAFDVPRALVVLRTREEHDKFVDAIGAQWPAATRAAAKSAVGFAGFLPPQGRDPIGRAFSECWTSDRTVGLEEWVVHQIAEETSKVIAGGDRLWLHEGLAIAIARATRGTSASLCEALVHSTVARNERTVPRTSAEWPATVRDWVQDGRDPDLAGLWNCRKWSDFDTGALVKAWSLCEFLIVEHGARLGELMIKMRASPEHEDEHSLKAVFGWSLRELDERWRYYVRRTCVPGRR